MANEKEILRGTIVLDTKSFLQKLDALPKEVEQRAGKLNSVFNNMAKAADQGVDKIIPSLKKLQSELEVTKNKLDEVSSSGIKAWRELAAIQGLMTTQMRQNSKKMADGVVSDLRQLERTKETIRTNDLRGTAKALETEQRLRQQHNQTTVRQAQQTAQELRRSNIPIENRAPANAPVLRVNDFLNISSSVNKVNNELAEAEKRVYALYRAGAQISQLSFMFSLFSSSVVAGVGMLVKGAEGFDTWTRKAYASGLASGEFAVSVKEVQQAVLDMGASIGSFDPTEIAEAFYYWQSAVGSTVSSVDDLTNILQNQLLPVMQAASLSEIPIGQAIKGVTSAVGEFGLEMGEAAHVAQVMLAATQLTNSEFADMIQSFTYLGAGAAQLGISVEEAAAVMGRLADVNVRGGNAGRALQQVLQGIIDPSNKAAAALDNIFAQSMNVGESWENILFPGGEFVGLLDETDKITGEIVQKGMLSLMADELRQMDEHNRQLAVSQITTNNAFRALMPLLEDYVYNTDTASRRTQELYTILSNNPAELFGTQLGAFSEGIREQFGRRINEIKAMLIEFGLAAQYALIPILDAFATMAKHLRALAEAHPIVAQFIIQMTALAAVGTTVAAVFGLVLGNMLQLRAIVTLIPAIKAMSVAMFAAFANIPGMIVLISAAILGLWVAWRNNWENIRSSISEAGALFQDLATNIAAVVESITNIIRALVRGDLNEISEYIDQIAERIIASLLQVAASIGPAIVALMRSFFSDVDNILEDWLGGLYTAGRDAAKNLMSGMRATIKTEMEQIVQLANTYLGGIGALNPMKDIVTPRALGGITLPGELTLVGERGPELVRLPAGSRVYPAHQTDSIINARPMASGGVVTPSGPDSGMLIDVGSGAQSGQTFAEQFNQGFAQNVKLADKISPAEVTEKAMLMGRTFGDYFISGFSATDFGQLNTIMDTITENLQGKLEGNMFGGGIVGIQGYIAALEQGIDISSQLVRVVQNGGDVTDEMYAQLQSVAGDAVDDILQVAFAWGKVQQVVGAIKVQQDFIDALNDQKQGLEDQRTAIQDNITALEDQKEPYQDQLDAIDKIITGLNRQKRELDRMKEPFEDALEAIDDIVRGLERTITPLRDAQYEINLQRQALQDIVRGIDDQLEAHNRSKELLEDSKQQYEDQIDLIDEIIAGLNRQKKELEYQKMPIQDAIQGYQDQIDAINEIVSGLQEQLELQRETQEDTLRPLRESLDARRLELDIVREAEELRREGVQDELTARQEALDLVKDRVTAEYDASREALNIRKQELDATKTRFALEEEIARRRTEQAELMGASDNVVQYLKFQEAALKKLHGEQLDPADQRLRDEEALLARREKIDTARIEKEQAVIDRAEDVERRRSTVIDRQFRTIERENTALQRRIDAQDRQYERDNRVLEQQLKAEEKRIAAIEKDQTIEEKKLTAIERQEKLLDRAIALEDRKKEPYEAQLKIIEKQQDQLDREMRKLELEKQGYDDQITVLDRQSQQLDRQAALIERQIELENRKQEALADEIRAIERREKVLNRQIEDQQDAKLGPQTAIENIDEQIKGEEKKEKSISRQIELKDREITLAQRTLSDLQDQKKEYDDILNDAEALAAWHERINKLLADQKKELENDRGAPPDPKQPILANTINDIAPVDMSALEKSLFLAGILWDEYRKRIAVVGQGINDDWDTYGGFLLENTSRLIGFLAATWLDEGATLLRNTGTIGSKIADNILMPLMPTTLLPRMAENLRGVIEGLAGMSFGDSLGDLDNVFKGLGDAGGGARAVGGIDEAAESLSVIGRIQAGLDDIVRSGPEARSVIGDIVDMYKNFGSTGSVDDLTKIVTNFDSLAVSGLKVGNIFTGLKNVLGAGGPIGWLITIALDAIIVFVKNWDAISDRIGQSFTFIAKVIKEELGPVFDSFIQGTMERGGPALRNIMVVLGFIDEVIQVLITTLGVFLDKMGPVMGPVFEAATIVLSNFLEIAKLIWFLFLDLLALDFEKMGTDIANAFSSIMNNGEKLRAVMVELIGNLIPALIDGILAAGPVLTNAFLELLGHIWPDAEKKLREIGNNIKEWWDNLPIGLKDALKGAAMSMISPFTQLWDTLFGHSIFPDLLKELKIWWTSLPGNIISWIGDFVGIVSKPFTDVWTWIDNWLGISAETGLRKGFKDGLNSIKVLVGQLVGGGEVSSLSNDTILGKIVNPFIAVYNWIDQDLLGGENGTKGLKNLFNNAFTMMRDNTAKIIGNFTAGGSFEELSDDTLLGKIVNPFIRLYNWVGKTLFGAGDGESGLIARFKTGFSTIKENIGTLVGVFGSGGDGLQRIEGDNILSKVVNPFIDILNWVGNTMFGDAEGEGLVGKFTKGFGKVKTVVEAVLGVDENTGIWSIFKKLYDMAFKPLLDAFDKLIHNLTNFPGIPGPLQQLMDLANRLFGGGGQPQGAGGYTPPPTSGQGAGGYAMPIDNYSSELQLHHGGHPGAVDMFAAEGTPIRAVGSGRVSDTSYNELGGNIVWVDGDDGRDYYYAHLNKPAVVSPGQHVSAGTVLGGVGRTGNAVNTPPHLHLGIGYGIGDGAGADGGAGLNFDAVGFLRSLQAGAGVPVEQFNNGGAQADTGFFGADIMGQLKTNLMEYFKGFFGKGDYDIASGTGSGVPSGNLPGVGPTDGTGAGRWRPIIEAVAKSLGIADPDVIQAIMQIESTGDPNAGSSQGAVGLMQIIPEYHAWRLPGGDVWNPHDNTYMGSHYLREMQQMFGSWYSAAAAYIGGPGGIVNGRPRNDNPDAFGSTSLSYAEKFRATLSGIKGVNVPNTYRDGLFSVPHDMTAMIHKNEMIIPADFARQLRQSVTMSSSVDTSDITRTLVPLMTQMMENQKSPEVHYHLTIDGQQTALDPDANRRMLQRMAHVTGGKLV